MTVPGDTGVAAGMVCTAPGAAGVAGGVAEGTAAGVPAAGGVAGVVVWGAGAGTACGAGTVCVWACAAWPPSSQPVLHRMMARRIRARDGSVFEKKGALGRQGVAALLGELRETMHQV